MNKKDRANQNSGYSRSLPSKVQNSHIIYKRNIRQRCSGTDGSTTKYYRSKKIQFNKNELKEMQKISTILTDIATSKVLESRRDKQLPRVDRIYPDNSMEKQNNSPDGELPRVDRQVTKEVNNK